MRLLGVVALLAEGVDRNLFDIIQPHILRVALLAEGVDRNSTTANKYVSHNDVALLAEGVDRNVKAALVTGKGLCSRPPRGGRG